MIRLELENNINESLNLSKIAGYTYDEMQDFESFEEEEYDLFTKLLKCEREDLIFVTEDEMSSKYNKIIKSLDSDSKKSIKYPLQGTAAESATVNGKLVLLIGQWGCYSIIFADN